MVKLPRPAVFKIANVLCDYRSGTCSGASCDRLAHSPRTPVRVNVLSGIAATIFMIVAVNLNRGSTASTFVVVLYMAISTTLISYIAIFPTVIKLRYSHPDVPRPYRVPGGKPGAWIAAASAPRSP